MVLLFIDERNMEKRRLLRFRTLFPIPLLSHHSIAISAFRHICLSKRGVAHLHSRSKPRVFPRSGWVIIDPSIPIEEESIPTYRPEKF